MSRYEALRGMGCGTVASGFISFLNWLMGIPAGFIQFMHITIEYDHDQQDH